MLIFLYGQDTYRSWQKLNEIVEHYKSQKSGFSLRHLDLKEKNFLDFQDEIRSASMFKEKKLVVLENAFLNKDFKESFLKKSQNYINFDDIILFYEANEVKKSDSLFKFFKKHGKCQEFVFLEGPRLKSWIKKELEALGAEIGQRALERLIIFVGNDLWQMANEIKKLVSYGRNKKIEAKDVELLVKPKIETDIFETIDAIAQKNKRRALFLLRKHLEKGDSSAYLLSMIQFQFRNILAVKELIEKNKPYGAILKMSKLHPFIVKKSYSLVQKFTFPELKKIYQKIFQVDRAIKTGRMEPDIALDILITEV